MKLVSTTLDRKRVKAMVKNILTIEIENGKMHYRSNKEDDGYTITLNPSSHYVISADDGKQRRKKND